MPKAAKHLALVGTKTGPIEFSGVALPYKPPIDKIAALCLLAHKNGTQLETIEYWKTNECPDEQFTLWRSLGIYPIDIGDRKYHAAGVGSAAEFVATEFKVESPGVTKLVELINRNNKTGSLKGQHLSIAAILRELYELTDDDQQHMQVINEAAEVIQAYLRVEDGSLVQTIDQLAETLPDLLEQLKACNDGPMTLGRYVRDLWLLGTEPSVIHSKIAYWLDNYHLVQTRFEEAQKAFGKMSPLEEDVAGTKLVVLKTDNRFLVKAATKSGKYGIRLIISGSGHTVISTNGYNLAKLHARLTEMEPGQWYYQPMMGALINGGPQYVGVEPTGLGFRQLIGLTKALVQPKVKK